MTKKDVKAALKSGKSMYEAFELMKPELLEMEGQCCIIFKTETLPEEGDEIAYIADSGVLNVPLTRPLDECEIMDALNICYTVNDFLAAADGNVKLAQVIFDGVSWESPSTYRDFMEEEDVDEARGAIRTDTPLGDLVAIPSETGFTICLRTDGHEQTVAKVFVNEHSNLVVEKELPDHLRTAEFHSVWNDGEYDIATSCKINLDSCEVFDIGIDDEDVERLNNLDEEYVQFTLDDGSERVLPAYRKEDVPDEEAPGTYVWYD